MEGSPVIQCLIFQEVRVYGNLRFLNIRPESSGLRTMAAIEAGERTLNNLRKTCLWARDKFMAYNFRKPQKDLSLALCHPKHLIIWGYFS